MVACSSGISRGSPEQVIDGWRYFGFQPRDEGDVDAAAMARRHTEVFLDVIEGEGFAQPNPRPMFANPPGLLRVEPYSEGLRERIWWGASSNATAQWAASLGMNLMSSTLKDDESGKPFHVQQAEQIELFRKAWAEAGWDHEPRVSVSRSIMPIVDRRGSRILRWTAATTGPDRLHRRRRPGRSSGAATRPSPTCSSSSWPATRRSPPPTRCCSPCPNQLGVDYNARLIETVLRDVAPGLGWR